MKLTPPLIKNEDGFILGELLAVIVSSTTFWAAVAVVLICFGLYGFFHNEINNSLKNLRNGLGGGEKTIVFKPVKFNSNPNVFTSRTAGKSQPAPLPKEPIRSENNREGAPTSIATVAGEWHGRYTATSPSEFKGKGGGWEAQLSEDKNGKISGHFTSEFDINGDVSGERTGDDATWNVGGGDSGLNFSGTVKGNTISGKFWGEIFKGQQAKGTFFGGRKVISPEDLDY